MKISVVFEDDAPFTAAEAEQMYHTAFGKKAVVEVLPRNNTPEAHIYFGIQNIIGLEQLEYYYEYYPHLYSNKMNELKKETLLKVSEILDQVIKDNESKVME